MFPALQLPPANLKVTKQAESFWVWCVVRKKNLLLTPEEWVRQHVIHFLLDHKQVGAGKLVSEMPLSINNQTRRADLVILDDHGNGKLIVECKATTIPIDEKTFLQTSNYVQKTGAQYFWMTNGLQHVIMDCREGKFIQDLPENL
jgi:predicted type IV restriction endonuclease